MKDVDNTKTINILSLCTGYGGLEIGLSRALEGIFRVVAVEIEAYALANLAAKTQEGKLAIEAMWPDLKTFPRARFRGCFDFILAGYPCQPFSVAGKRQGTDDPRHLWPYVRKCVAAVRPVWVFLENVPGHLTMGYSEVYRDLRALDYKVEPGLFTAAECGAPHKRQRLFILAKSESQRCGKKRKYSFRHSIGLAGTSGKFPDTECQGLQKPGVEISNEQTQRFPSRPGQPQYEWEEPRVVANATKLSIKGCANRSNSKTGYKTQIGTQKGQAQSSVGGAVNGIVNRVDRLRLLGNGVVPQQAEKAFRELIKLF